MGSPETRNELFYSRRARFELNRNLDGTEWENGTSMTYPAISRWSYAIPIEVIYLTPLTKWNPYNVTYVEDDSEFVDGLSGQCGDEPLQNLKGNHFYMTP